MKLQDNRLWLVVLAGGVVLAAMHVCCAEESAPGGPAVAPSPPAEAAAVPSPPAGPADEAAAKAEVLTQAPLHEAYAAPTDGAARPGAAAPRKPPEPIGEVPPEAKPEGENVTWIPGYWKWDADRSDFIWISGVWRAIPPGMRWVAGYWAESEGTYRWVSGFWGSAAAEALSYLPPAPESIDIGPSSPPPGDDHFWVPGTWVFRAESYVWRPGCWSPVLANWVWTPAQYLWTPRGCLFVDGYWDYPFAGRGALYCPVYFRHVHDWPRLCYTPRVSLCASDVFFHLFVRPGCGHYYYGDYYGRHRDACPYVPWYEFTRIGRHCDPFHAHFTGLTHRNGYDAISRYRGWHDYFAQHGEHRPPRIHAADHDILATSIRGAGPGPASMARLIDARLVKPDAGPRFTPLTERHRGDLQRDVAEVRDLGDRRLRGESDPAARSKTGRGGGSLSLPRARSPELAATTRVPHPDLRLPADARADRAPDLSRTQPPPNAERNSRLPGRIRDAIEGRPRDLQVPAGGRAERTADLSGGQSPSDAERTSSRQERTRDRIDVDPRKPGSPGDGRAEKAKEPPRGPTQPGSGRNSPLPDRVRDAINQLPIDFPPPARGGAEKAKEPPRGPTQPGSGRNSQLSDQIRDIIAARRRDAQLPAAGRTEPTPAPDRDATQPGAGRNSPLPDQIRDIIAARRRDAQLPAAGRTEPTPAPDRGATQPGAGRNSPLPDQIRDIIAARRRDAQLPAADRAEPARPFSRVTPTDSVPRGQPETRSRETTNLRRPEPGVTLNSGSITPRETPRIQIQPDSERRSSLRELPQRQSEPRRPDLPASPGTRSGGALPQLDAPRRPTASPGTSDNRPPRSASASPVRPPFGGLIMDSPRAATRSLSSASAALRGAPSANSRTGSVAAMPRSLPPPLASAGNRDGPRFSAPAARGGPSFSGGPRMAGQMMSQFRTSFSPSPSMGRSHSSPASSSSAGRAFSGHSAPPATRGPGPMLGQGGRPGRR